jgi:predicted ArsR family transcriptional regulator
MATQNNGSTRGRIVRLLRKARQSVNDLASSLGLTDNAVRANLARLERDGLIEQAGSRPSFRKPESVYDITPAAEQLFAKAYAPVLATVLRVMESHLDERELDAQLREVGRQLAAPHLEALAKLQPEERGTRTLEILEQLGGLAELEQRDGGLFVRGFGCPFSQVVAQHPKLCIVAEAMVGELLGRPVTEQCERQGRPRCCFVVSDDASAVER